MKEAKDYCECFESADFFSIGVAWYTWAAFKVEIIFNYPNEV